jgi:hypothetical protein
LGASFLDGRHAGGCPAATHFLLLRQKKVSKEKASRMRRPCALLRARCVARSGRGLARTRLRLKQSRALIRPALRYSPTHSGVGGSAARPALPGIAAHRCGGAPAVQCGAPRHEHCLPLPPPSGCAEERRARRVRTGDCLSRRRVRARPRLVRAPQVARSAAKGRIQRGRLFFAYFLLASQKKVSCRRATPGTCQAGAIKC